MVKVYVIYQVVTVLANVYLDGLVGSAHGWKAEGSGFDPGPGKKKKKRLFLSYSYVLYINK